MTEFTDIRSTDLADVPAYFPWGITMSREAIGRLAIAPPETCRRSLDKEPDYQAIRTIADKVNAARSGDPILAGALLTASAVTDILRWIAAAYAIDQEPGITARTIAWLETRSDLPPTHEVLNAFVDLYPPEDVLSGETPATEAFNSMNDTSYPRSDQAFWESALLSICMSNPAMKNLIELYDDHEYRRRAEYTKTIATAETYLTEQPAFAALNMPIFDALRAPMKAHPDSLENQLTFMIEQWAKFLPQAYVRRLRVARGVLKEERTMRGLGPGPVEPLTFGAGASGTDDYPELERFSTDADWMLNVVMLAKSTYVWLDQISKRVGRPINRLDEVPDDELQIIASRGFNCVWLIGVWERSIASQWIKQRMGNHDAVSSAYSLYDYEIAADLGGHDAYCDLRDRAARFGIRLGSDMVPNHVGIHSKWMVEHPDWFVQSQSPPFPGYSFNCEDLSPDDRMCVQIEDGYWEHRDAAVVFKRTDTWTGDTRYIYHGNDGTSMPWNDTAQLNYLNAEVREAVIQTILHVARLFPVIRFDAAMTLAKKHFQRLWFPKTGDEGAIPSRAEHSMTREAFDQAMPEEFWREVVDRVAEEVPDTLLLAEAFWLMEGYFVRTLGMHRVYNSAFMNMLKMEENAKYRLTIKNVLEFSPKILNRFVNFMSNPDERTALEQFGKDDKYFGCCVLLSTLPGLPMFAHGQIEGYSEKYGMEYRRAYWDESPDESFVRRHEREIFPLLRSRYLFGGADNFALFDFHNDGGYVDEDVFAYTNRAGDERALIIFNNAFRNNAGSARSSTAINRGPAETPYFEHPNLCEALGLEVGPQRYWVYRDHRDGMQYIRHSQDLESNGMHVTLHAYQYHAFLDWQSVIDTDGSWRAVCAHLAGGGVPDVGLERRRLRLSPLIDSFDALLTPDLFKAIAAMRNGSAKATDAIAKHVHDVLEEIAQYTTAAFDAEAITESIIDELHDLWKAHDRIDESDNGELIQRFMDDWFGDEEEEPESAKAKPVSHYDGWTLPALWIVLNNVGEAFAGASRAAISAAWIDDWLLAPSICEALIHLGRDERHVQDDADLLAIGLDAPLRLDRVQTPVELLDAMVNDNRTANFLQLHRWDGVQYVTKERLERLVEWHVVIRAIRLGHDATVTRKQWNKSVAAMAKASQTLSEAAEESGYRIEEMREAIAKPASAARKKVKKNVHGSGPVDVPPPNRSNRDRG